MKKPLSVLTKQTEEMIAMYCRRIRFLHEVYNPNADYLTITIYKDRIFFNNRYYEEDEDFPLNYIESERKDAT